MDKNKKWDILYIQEENSQFNSDSSVFSEFFNKVDKVQGKEKALEFFDANTYDMIIADISVNPEDVVLLKQMKDKKQEQIIFALVDPKDTEKLYKIAESGINAFELNPEQFEQALETIAGIDPYSGEVQ